MLAAFPLGGQHGGVACVCRDKTVQLLGAAAFDGDKSAASSVALPDYAACAAAAGGLLFVGLKNDAKLSVVKLATGEAAAVSPQDTPLGGTRKPTALAATVFGNGGGVLVAAAGEAEGRSHEIETAVRPVVARAYSNEGAPLGSSVEAGGELHRSDVGALAFSSSVPTSDGASGKVLLAAGDAKQVVVYSVGGDVAASPSAFSLHAVPGTDMWKGFHTAKVTSLCFTMTSTSTPLLASGGLDRRVILWTPEDGKTGKRTKLDEAHKEGVSELVLLPAGAGAGAGGGLLVSGGADGSVKGFAVTPPA